MKFVNGVAKFWTNACSFLSHQIRVFEFLYNSISLFHLNIIIMFMKCNVLNVCVCVSLSVFYSFMQNVFNRLYSMSHLTKFQVYILLTQFTIIRQLWQLMWTRERSPDHSTSLKWIHNAHIALYENTETTK